MWPCQGVTNPLMDGSANPVFSLVHTLPSLNQQKTIVHKMTLKVNSGFHGPYIYAQRILTVIQKTVLGNVTNMNPITDGRSCTKRAY